MKVRFNFCKIENYGIAVTDTSEYLAESNPNFIFQEFKASQIYCVDVLEKHSIDEESVYKVQVSPSRHTVKFESLIDGWYTIHHIILPSAEYFNKLKEEGGVLYQYNGFYYTDGEKFYKFASNESKEVDITEIVTRNPLNTSILSYCVNYFSIYQLNECFIKLAEKTLSGAVRCKIPGLEELTFNRDLVWMALNVIKYYVELGKLEEAETLLHKLDACNGICNNLNNPNYDNKDQTGCGCR